MCLARMNGPLMTEFLGLQPSAWPDTPIWHFLTQLSAWIPAVFVELWLPFVASQYYSSQLRQATNAKSRTLSALCLASS